MTGDHDAAGYGRLLTLVHADRPGGGAGMYACGMQITTGAGELAVVVTPGRAPGAQLLGGHDSVESACARHSFAAPLTMAWAGDRTVLPSREPSFDPERPVLRRA